MFRGLGCFSTPPQIITDDDYREKTLSLFESDIHIFVYNIDKFNKEGANMKKINEGTSVSVDRPMVDAMKRGLPFLTPARGIMQYAYDAYYSENQDFHPMYLQQQIRVVYDINDIVSDYLVDYYNSYSRETYDITPVTVRDLSPDTEELFSMDDYPERFFRWADEFISLIS